MTKILLVEDDKSLSEIYYVRLKAEGYEILSASDGEQALALAIKEIPDLIISDVMMPNISGFDMLDILRSTTETKNIHVIMMTALSSEEQRQRGMALGADRYLVKSQVGIEDVVRTVHEVLGDANGQGPKPLVSQPSPQQPQPTLSSSQFSQTIPPQQNTTPATPQQTQTRIPVAAAQTISGVQTPSAAPQATTTPATQPSTPQSGYMTPEPQRAQDTYASPQAQQQESSLPQPVAPFSTNRPGSNRVIEPLPESSTEPIDFTSKMSEELSGKQNFDAIPSPVMTQSPAPAMPTQPATAQQSQTQSTVAPQTTQPQPIQNQMAQALKHQVPTIPAQQAPTPQQQSSSIPQSLQFEETSLPSANQ